MAQYWEDWSGSTIGSAPTGWTARWDSGATYSVISDAAGPAGRALKCDKSSGRHAITFNAVDSDADRATIKIRALIKASAFQSSASTYAGVLGRGSGTGTSETAYISALSQTGTNASTASVVFTEYLNAAATTDHDPYLWTAGNLYWVGLELNGTSVRRTLATAADPSTLLVDATDSNADISAAGWAGLFFFVASASPYYVYAVGVGTNGDEAPVADPSKAIAGAAIVSAGAAGTLTTGAPVKGVSLALYSGSTPQSNITGITALWWDTATPSAFSAPIASATTASTDASGVFTLNLAASTALDIGQTGFLMLYKAGASATDDLIFAGRLAVQDIA